MLVVGQHDLGTALVLFAIMLGMLWVVGAPARLFGSRSRSSAVVAFYLAATNAERRTRLTSFVDPFKDFQGAGWQAGHGLLRDVAAAASSARGLGASQQKWGNLPEAHTDFIFAVLGEELGLVGTLLVLALFGAIAYAGDPGRDAAPQDPFVRYVAAGITIWLIVADDDQHRHGAGAAAGHRHPAAAGLLRRLGAAAVAGRARPARRLRARRARGRGRAADRAATRRAAGSRPRRRPEPLGAARPRRRRDRRPRVEARLMAGVCSAAGPAGRRRHGRAHLAAARHRRRAAPPRPRRRDHLRSAPPRGLETRVVPRPATRSS